MTQFGVTLNYNIYAITMRWWFMVFNAAFNNISVIC